MLKCRFLNRDLSVINPVWYYIYVALGEVSKITVLTSKVPYLMILRSKKEKKKDADGKVTNLHAIDSITLSHER